MKFLVAIACVGLTVSGCNKSATPASYAETTEKPVSLNGQVFIVTKARDNIKLALVTVRAYTKSDYEHTFAIEEQAYKDRLAEDVKPLLEAIEKKRGAAKDKQTVLDAIDKELADYARQIEELTAGSEEFKRAGEARYQLFGKRVKAKNEAEEAKTGLRRDEEAHSDLVRLARTAVPNAIIKALTFQPVTEAKTDADGRFQLKLMSGEYYIVASAVRSVFKDEESYYWFVPQKIGTEEAAIFLSNDNQYSLVP